MSLPLLIIPGGCVERERLRDLLLYTTYLIEISCLYYSFILHIHIYYCGFCKVTRKLNVVQF